jgi:hypothetical protein
MYIKEQYQITGYINYVRIPFFGWGALVKKCLRIIF